MKFAVDLTQCENHGQCTIAAPALFSFDDSGELSFRNVAAERYVSDQLTDGDVATVGLAVDVCPMQAISLADD